MPENAIATMSTPAGLVVSDEFELGQWDGAPLTWRILRLEDGKATVLCRTAVDQRAYQNQGGATTWEKSSLRAWLNAEFFSQAFSAEEAALIIPQDLNTADNPDYQTAGGISTCDNVYCLSYEECLDLLAVEPRRALAGDNGLWWLRTAGGQGDFAVYVHNNGWINTYGYNVDEPHVSVRPAMVVDVAKLVGADASSLVRSSAYGEELLLEAMELEDLSCLAPFVEAFGVDESWESYVVETLEAHAQEGDGAALERVFDLFGSVEYLSGALAQAIGCGHVTAASTLIRHGARLDGKCARLRLVNDTPELRKARKATYGAGSKQYDAALDGEGAGHAVRLLMNQETLKSADYRGLLAAAAAREDKQDLYEWMLCPDREPIQGLKARWSGKRVSVVRGGMHRDVPVSSEGLRRLWCAQLCQDDPETVRNMAPYLGYRDLEDKGALLNLLAQEGWNRELSDLLGIYKMFSISQLSEAVKVARSHGRKSTATLLLDLLRSIGAGKIAQEQEG